MDESRLLLWRPFRRDPVTWILAGLRRRLRLLRMWLHAKKYGAPVTTYPNPGNPAAPRSFITWQETDEIIPVRTLARGLR